MMGMDGSPLAALAGPGKGRWGSFFGKYFNTEKERGPRRTTKKASMALRAKPIPVVASLGRQGAAAEEILAPTGWSGASADGPGDISLVPRGPRSFSVLKIDSRTPQEPRRFPSGPPRSPTMSGVAG